MSDGSGYQAEGEEFAVLMPDTSPSDAVCVVERVRAGVAQMSDGNSVEGVMRGRDRAAGVDR